MGRQRRCFAAQLAAQDPRGRANGPGAWSTLLRSVNVLNHIRPIAWRLRSLLPGPHGMVVVR